MIYLRNFIYFSLLMLSCCACADTLLNFSSETNRVRYQGLITELRCPKCQNQNLADSASGIAVDLRQQVYEMIESGRSDQEVVEYMVARYGDFVLYRPQKNMGTFILWYGPFILLGVGVLIFALVLFNNRKKRGVKR